jgi:transposase-like protein
MAENRKTTIRYSISFKQHVVREIEKGLSMMEARRKYGISGGDTIHHWIRKFGKNHLLNKIVRIETMGEKDRVKSLKEELKRLKLALADSLLAQRCLEEVIKEADKEYKTDLKKSFGELSFKDSGSRLK